MGNGVGIRQDIDVGLWNMAKNSVVRIAVDNVKGTLVGHIGGLGVRSLLH